MSKKNYNTEIGYLRDALDSNCIITLVMDEKYRILFINDGAEEISGYGREYLIGKNCVTTFVPAEHRKIAEKIIKGSFRQSLSSRISEKVILPIITRTGETKMLYWRGKIRTDKNGKKILVAFAHDVTAEYDLQKKLKAKEQLYGQLVDNSFALIYTKDLEGKYTLTNPVWKIYHGVKRKEAIGRTDYQLFNKKAAEKFQKNDAVTLKKNTICEFYDEFTHDGKKHVQLTVKYPLKDERGRNTGVCGISHDITDKILIEKEKQIFEQIFEQASEGMIVITLDGIVLNLNKAWAKMHGYNSRRTLVGKHRNIFHTAQQIREEVEPYRKKSLKNKHISGIIWHKRKDGSVFPARMTTSLLKNEKDKPIAFLSIARDITKELKLEHAIEESEKRYRALVETAPNGVLICDKFEKLIFVNTRLARMLGYSVKEMEGSSLSKYADKENFQKFKTGTRDRMSGMSSQYEVEFITRKGKRLQALLSAAPLFDEKGKYKNSMSVVTDITDIKEAEKALRESEKKYRSLFDNLNVGVYRTTAGKHGKLVDANPALVKMLGYDSKEEMMHIHIADTYKNASEREHFNAIVGREESYENENLRLKKKDGIPIVVFDSARAIKDEKGNIVYFDGILEDVTEKRKLEEQIKCYAEHLEKMVLERTHELEQQTKKALEANKIKTDFLGSVSHELRTPLTSIIGYTELLEDQMLEKFAEEQKSHLLIIKKNAKQLLHLISDILDITKIEKNRLPLEIEECSIRKVLEDIQKVFAPLFTKKGIDLITNIEEGTPEIWKTDRQKLRQILFNLTSNALKFTLRGLVTITVSKQKSNLHFKITDTGIGIAPKDQEKLFEVFQRTSNPLVQKTEGSGLGLVITKKLVTLLGGKVEVKSELGKGSSFIVSFPL